MLEGTLLDVLSLPCPGPVCGLYLQLLEELRVEPGRPQYLCLKTEFSELWMPGVGTVTQPAGSQEFQSWFTGHLGHCQPGFLVSFSGINSWGGVRHSTGPDPQTVLVKPTCSESAQNKVVGRGLPPLALSCGELALGPTSPGPGGGIY